MSSLPDHPPDATRQDDAAVLLLLEGRPRDLGGFSVRRLLPAVERRLVGPFIFFDHMGPADFAPGQGIDVRPHPHIALATVTYLFEGEIFHRDSLGSAQAIRPGAVNWMMAGSGIVHSERSAPEVRARGGALDGIQAWVALPTAREEDAPRFEHHDAAAIPLVTVGGARLRVLAGTAYGATSPVGVASPTLYVDAELDAGATLAVTDEHRERAVYVVRGVVTLDGHRARDGEMLILRPGARVSLAADGGPARLMLLGGAPLDGERHIYWNFVASSQERIEAAKEAWRQGRFPKVPGDDKEFIPLPR